MRSIISIVLAALTGLGLVAQPACLVADTDCEEDSHCKSGRVCRDGECVSGSGNGGKGNGGSSSGGSPSGGSSSGGTSSGGSSSVPPCPLGCQNPGSLCCRPVGNPGDSCDSISCEAAGLCCGG
jgi:hypothetical protein